MTKRAGGAGLGNTELWQWLLLMALLTVLAGCGGGSSGLEESAAREDALGAEAASADIQHIVVVTMENRSFDHFLGWMSNADGETALQYKDRAGQAHPTYRLAPDYQGCGHADPDHGYPASRVDYDGGRMDGFLRAGTNDLFSIGYYAQGDLPFLGRAAPRWTTLDRYFASVLGPTFPNRIYLHAAQTDRLDNTQSLSTLPTLWDRLAEKGVTGRYYYSDYPLLALWGARYIPISRPFPAFLADAALGQLPAVAYVDPRFLGEDQGVSSDDHPFSDIRNGEYFLSQVYNAVTQGPGWAHTVLVITFDEGGGFFEHVPPPLAPIPAADRAVGNDGRLGFRVPAIVISPWSRRGDVSHQRFEHASVLRMIEARFGLRPLTVRDATANNLAQTLEFSQRARTSVEPILVPPGPYGTPCSIAPPGADEDGALLKQLAEQYGWPLPAP